MLIWEELKLVPDINSAVIVGENICNTCEKWGEACETCDVSVPIICDFHYEKVKMAQVTIYGISVGEPYEIKE